MKIGSVWLIFIYTKVFGWQTQMLDGGPYFKASGAVSFYVECQTQEDVDYFWNKLTGGGNPSAQQCGWLQDKYGFSWQIIPTVLPRLLNDPDKAKADRVMQAMLQMKKIEIEKLRQAYEGK